MTRELTQDFEDFVQKRVGSMECVEVLLLLQRAPEKWWSAAAVAADLGVSPGTIAPALDSLCAANLLDVRVAADVLFRYAPRPEDEPLVRQLGEAWRSRRLLVLRLFSVGRDSVRAFADAFRIGGRGGDDDR